VRGGQNERDRARRRADAAGFHAHAVHAAALSKGQRDKMTPDQVIARMKQGNERFRSGKMSSQDYLAGKRATAAGQYPAAVILSCIDSGAQVPTSTHQVASRPGHLRSS
jgi:hypothetical protein